MDVTADSSEAPSSNDQLRAWEEFRSRLHESGHRFNYRHAQQKYSSENTNPQEVLKVLTKTFERTAAMAVKTDSEKRHVFQK